ncbi:hypothetical protein BKA57DRAFT_76845 [Linnemannia elongata]|nr:hypothetical protein BKA57DRAFT_76845 [Linnemannia elongata]
MQDHPQYFGHVTHLGDLQQLSINQYFIHNAVKTWTLSHFLRFHNNHNTFLEGLLTVSKVKAVNPAIRSYAKACSSYYDGELGQLRIQKAREEATNYITTDILSRKERSLAQAVAEVAVERELQETRGSKYTEKDTKRDLELDESTSQPSKRVLSRRSPTPDFQDSPHTHSTLVEASPFDAEVAADTEIEEDPVAVAELNSHRRLSIVFDSDYNFEFECKVGDLEMSERFTKYYELSIAKAYDPDNFQDFLATGGVLFLDEEPTVDQRVVFHDDYNVMLNTISSSIERASERDELDAITLC